MFSHRGGSPRVQWVNYPSEGDGLARVQPQPDEDQGLLENRRRNES
jgi:hypothetical protein